MVSVAIIVPFRIQKGQNRGWELEQFSLYMTKYMDEILKKEKINKYHIYVIEQDYGKKFNRGMLLNIGFHLTNKSYNTFIFHDVDLLPSKNIQRYYSIEPKYKQTCANVIRGPIHIGSCWKDRYSNHSYFGGIISFGKKMFEDINGFPNHFWGWGGEDDALMDRCSVNNIVSIKVNGKINDIEQDSFGNSMNLEEKLQFLKKNKDWKCHDKWECRDKDKLNWENYGYNTIHEHYKIIKWETVHEITKITVRV